MLQHRPLRFLAEAFGHIVPTLYLAPLGRARIGWYAPDWTVDDGLIGIVVHNADANGHKDHAPQKCGREAFAQQISAEQDTENRGDEGKDGDSASLVASDQAVEDDKTESTKDQALI